MIFAIKTEREVVLGLFEEYIGTHVYYYALLLSFSSWPCVVVRYQIVCRRWNKLEARVIQKQRVFFPTESWVTG